MIKVKQLQLCLFFTILLTIANAQTGTITGVVLEKSNNEPLIGATIRVEGMALGSMTDVNGLYTIPNVAPGKYRLVCSYISFAEMTVEAEVKAKQTVTADFSMVYSEETLAEVIIVGRQEQQSAGAVIGIAQRSATLVTGISQDDIRRSPDRTAGEILKRVSGTSIQDNKFVVVRGLSDRYNIALLNGMMLPSTEPDRRAFSFDIFPGNLLDNMLVFKTASPDMPGEFAGGIIQINTKEIPEKGFWQFSLSTTHNTQSAGKPYEFYQGGKTDWLGLDDGTRALPAIGDIKEFNQNEDDPDKKYTQSLLFKNDWEIIQESAMARSYGAQLSTAQHFRLGEKDLGMIASLTYNHSPRIVHLSNANFNADGTRTYSYEDVQSKINVVAGGMVNLTYSLDPRNRINFNHVLTINSEDIFISRNGISDEQLRYDRANAMQYTGNKFYNGQLQGEHVIGSGIKINWGLTTNITSRDIPSLRRMFYTKNLEPQYEGDTLYVAFVPTGGPSPTYAGRFYSTQKEQLIGVKGDLTFPYQLWNKTNNFKIGGIINTIDRNFDARVFGYVAAKYDFENLLLPQGEIFDESRINGDGFYVEESTNKSDSYTASALLPAGYAMFDQYLGDNWRFTGGMRMELFEQKVNSFTYGGDPVKVDNTTIDILPSLNISYSIQQKHKIRLAGSRTVSRPNFRELAPFAFYDFTYQRSVTGNPRLERTSISNLDLRYEFYPAANQQIAIGGFYKHFKNPIEQVVDAGTGGGSLGMNYANVPEAQNAGVELEWRWKPAIWLTLFGNLAFIQSKVDVSSVSTTEITVRPLQGQSPYVANAGISLGFSKIGFNTTALFNQIGRRIFQVGYTGYLDIYEAPRGILDWTITQRIFKNGEIKLTAADLLNQQAVYYQDRNESGQFEDTEDSRIFGAFYGSNFSVALAYKF